MISRTDGGNFLQAHYDWIVAGVGVLALAGAAAFCFLGGDVEQEIEEVTGGIENRSTSGALVQPVYMGEYEMATNATQVKSNLKLGWVAHMMEKDKIFASEKRLLCANKDCGRATPEHRDADENLTCAFCGFTQEVAKVEKAQDVDTDGDGIPDAVEKKYGLNPNDASDATADKDGDGFTNLEEYLAKTDPTDKNDHPDYLDSLRLQLPLRETKMPFLFIAANQIPNGWRCTFYNPRLKDDYGRLGRSFTAVAGEEIGTSGFIMKKYEKKEAKRAIQGGKGMMKTVDVSEVTVERKSDGKSIKLVISSKRGRPQSIETMATLVYERGSVKNFDVVAGSSIDLNGEKYRVVSITTAGKSVRVALEGGKENKKRVIEALEP